MATSWPLTRSRTEGKALVLRRFIMAILIVLEASRLAWFVPEITCNHSPATADPNYKEAKLGVNNPVEYKPASTEQYFMENMVNLGFDKSNNPRSCSVWTEPSKTNHMIHTKLTEFAKDLEAYAVKIKNFEQVPDLMKSIKRGKDIYEVCKRTRIHPNGLLGLFSSKELSFGESGHIEPLLPPMRHVKFCTSNKEEFGMSIDYLVHDFEFMCQKLRPHSRLVLLDFGASLSFHGSQQPMVLLMTLYRKFGFYFDHVYAFEMKKEDPENVFGNLLPEEYFPSYHWINVGVTAEEGHKLNPLHSILKTFDEQDFIVLKLDIDTSSIEMPLVRQLLEDKDSLYGKLIDQFYFEHHVHLGDLARAWGGTMNGTIQDSFNLFQGLRKKGIPSHFWP